MDIELNIPKNSVLDKIHKEMLKKIETMNFTPNKILFDEKDLKNEVLSLESLDQIFEKELSISLYLNVMTD